MPYVLGSRSKERLVGIHPQRSLRPWWSKPSLFPQVDFTVPWKVSEHWTKAAPHGYGQGRTAAELAKGRATRIIRQAEKKPR